MNEGKGTVGLGVDIVEIARMKRILERTPSFRYRVFTEEECAYCDATSCPEAHYATRFAAREAVVKALGTGFFHEGVSWRDIQVKRTSKGRPYVVLHGAAKRVAQHLGVRELPLSLSYTHTEAVACAMAITDDSIRLSEQRKDPMEELARQFKEARGMLDYIDSPSDNAADTLLQNNDYNHVSQDDASVCVFQNDTDQVLQRNEAATLCSLELPEIK